VDLKVIGDSLSTRNHKNQWKNFEIVLYDQSRKLEQNASYSFKKKSLELAGSISAESICHFFSVVTDLTNVQFFEMYNFSDLVLTSVSTYLTDLRIFGISECYDFNVNGFRKILANCQNLTELNLLRFTENQISNEELVDLFRIPNVITQLTLSHAVRLKSECVLCDILYYNPQITTFSVGGWSSNENDNIEEYLKTFDIVMDYIWF
jgi:hypothetical protein